METVPQQTTKKKKRKREDPNAVKQLDKAQANGDPVGVHEHAKEAEQVVPAAEQPSSTQTAAVTTAAGKAGHPLQPEEGHAHVMRDVPDAGGAGEAGDGEPAKPSKKAAPVLPWMRLPISVEPGQGVRLAQVRGLDPRLRASLQAGARAGAPNLDRAAPVLPMRSDLGFEIQPASSCGSSTAPSPAQIRGAINAGCSLAIDASRFGP